MINMLRFLIFLLLGVYAYLTSNENSIFSRHPSDKRYLFNHKFAINRDNRYSRFSRKVVL